MRRHGHLTLRTIATLTSACRACLGGNLALDRAAGGGDGTSPKQESLESAMKRAVAGDEVSQSIVKSHGNLDLIGLTWIGLQWIRLR